MTPRDMLASRDRDTGVVSIEKFVVVHDCGRVEGAEGSFMDYAMPRADQAPPLVLDHIENLSTRNPLGVKGLGEGGAIATAALFSRALCLIRVCVTA
jgi:CO/xanthine dehydrogenase Mo-binding subunit